jgi:hypothetical protein
MVIAKMLTEIMTMLTINRLLEVNMSSKLRLTKIVPTLGVAALALYATAGFTAAQSPVSARQVASASAQSLDYEFFKTRVEPIFLKKRPGHVRCYACHSEERGGGTSESAPEYLVPLSPGSTFWTEEQSRINFKRVSLYVAPGDPASSPLLKHPLAPEAGGDVPVHTGGRQFKSRNDPDWQTLAEWVRGKKASGSSGN